MKMHAPLFWTGEESRKVAIYAPCPCGCSPDWYISGSAHDGKGFTIWIRDEAAAQAVSEATGLPIVHDHTEA